MMGLGLADRRLDGASTAAVPTAVAGVAVAGARRPGQALPGHANMERAMTTDLTDIKTTTDQTTDYKSPAIATPPATAQAATTGIIRNIWIGGREAIEVPCSIEIEQTRDTLHAHVSLEGLDVELGDEVLVHDAPDHIAFGERIVTTSRATVVRASPLERALTRLRSYLQLTELYEVGFQPKEEIKFSTRKTIRETKEEKP
jgi:hypothetical protein